MARAVGIDLGTTNSVVSVLEGGEHGGEDEGGGGGGDPVEHGYKVGGIMTIRYE
jgi:hypothetical protein